MKKLIKGILIFLIVFAAFWSIGSEVQAATIYKTKSMTVEYKKNKKGRMKVSNYSGSLTWKTSDASVFAVESDGKSTIKGIGKATVTGKGTYKGKKLVIKITVTVVPKTLKIIYAERYNDTSLGTETSTVFLTWKKDTSVDGYELQMSVNSSFSKSETDSYLLSKKDIENYGTLSNNNAYEEIGLYEWYDKAYDQVYIRLRSYVKVGNKKYYSNWSSVKTLRKRNKSSKMKKYLAMMPD